jgi:hypothetical protein
MAFNLITSLDCNQNLNLNYNKNRNNNGNRVRQRKPRCSGGFKNWSRVNFPQRSAATERKHQAGNRIRGEGWRRRLRAAHPPPCEGGPQSRMGHREVLGLSNTR